MLVKQKVYVCKQCEHFSTQKIYRLGQWRGKQSFYKVTQDLTNHVNILCWDFLVQNTNFIRFWNNITGTVNLTQIGNLYIKLEGISPRHKISKTTQDRNIPPPPYPTFPTYCNRCMCANSPMPVTLTKAEASVLPKGFWATHVYRPSSSTRMSENKKQAQGLIHIQNSV